MIIPPFTAPRLVVSGLSGGGGKTLVSLGLTRALTLRGLRVKPCKKGPDYIDAAWLGLASGLAPTNLDPYFLSDARLRALFCDTFRDADLAVIEGNRGLYDGRDLEGSCSTATLARALDAPIILTLSVTKMTRTAAALVAGSRSVWRGWFSTASPPSGTRRSSGAASKRIRASRFWVKSPACPITPSRNGTWGLSPCTTSPRTRPDGICSSRRWTISPRWWKAIWMWTPRSALPAARRNCGTSRLSGKTRGRETFLKKGFPSPVPPPFPRPSQTETPRLAGQRGMGGRPREMTSMGRLDGENTERRT